MRNFNNKKVSRIEFDGPEQAFNYAFEHIVYNPKKCVGLVNQKIGVYRDGVLVYMVYVADGRLHRPLEVAYQHPYCKQTIDVGDLVEIEVETDRQALKEIEIDHITDRFCVIKSKLQPVYLFEPSHEKTTKHYLVPVHSEKSSIVLWLQKIIHQLKLVFLKFE